MSQTPAITKASFRVRNGSGGSGDAIPVHFNPESLQYVITNNLRNTGSGNATKQHVSESTGKLTLELLYDTTDTGEDVRLHTIKVAKFMEPAGSDKTPPVVEFEWGLYNFVGMVESYKEKLDLFSADGVPLRAVVNLTLSSQDKVFEGGSTDSQAATTGSLAGGREDGVQAPAPGGNSGRGVTQTATEGGNPSAGRDIAARNGLESMRFPDTARLDVGASASLGAAASLTVSAGVSAPSRANAGFAGLRSVVGGSAGGRLELDNFLGASATAQLGTELGAGFSLGGQAGLQGGASLKADVGKAGELKARIEFDGGG